VVAGSDPATMYPRQPEGSPWSGDPVPPEGPLGYEIHACEPVGEPHELRASIENPGPVPHPGSVVDAPVETVPALDQAVPSTTSSNGTGSGVEPRPVRSTIITKRRRIR
jgi:hypothetical protein